MDENKKYSEDEISKLYDEIEREFTSVTPNTNYYNQENKEEPTIDVTVEEKTEQQEYEDNIFVSQGSEPVFNPAPIKEQHTFYSETIKEEHKNKGSKKGLKKALAALVVASVICGGIYGGYYVGANKNQNDVASVTQTPSESKKPKASEEQTSTDSEYFKTNNLAQTSSLNLMSDMFVDVVNKVEPSVVAITTMAESANNFFNQSQEVQSGSGSGIIFHEENDKVYVVTNAHVISNANAVKVSIEESTGIPAKLVGADVAADLAVISLQKSDIENAGVKKLTVAKFGDSDKLKVGQIVLAIGNAFGQGNSATMGIISTKEKEITVSEGMPALTVIQTNATINFGNSGGPLVNLDGEVIGINTAKLSTAYGAEGMGYSIGANRIKPIVDSFMTRTNKPFLGVQGSTINQETAQMYGLPEAGVFIREVIENTSASKAGVKRNDIITAIDGKPVFSIEELTATIKEKNVGDKIKITVLRSQNDKLDKLVLEATLEKYTDVDF